MKAVDDWFILRDKDVIKMIGMGEIGKDVNTDFDKALLRVKIKMSGKGRLEENTVIHVPRESDLLETEDGLCEPKQNDDLELERKEKRMQHKEKMKRQKRQWKKVKNKKVLLVAQGIAEEKEVDEERMKIIDHSLSALKSLREEENSSYKEKAERLWEGECNTVRHSSSRQVMGWVVRGGYSYRVGGEVGEGLVTARGWIEWMQTVGKVGARTILTRETCSLQYRKASMELVL